GHCETYWDRESRVEDTMLFRDLARAESPAATLYESTDERPARSARWREFLDPQGYGDELRAVFRIGESTWGIVDLFRDRAREPFSSRDLEIIRAATPAIAGALRRLATTDSATPGPVAGDGPGTALFDGSGTLTSLDEQAERLFEELAGPNWSATPV